MASITPEQIFGAGYTADANNITIALSDLLPAGELSAAEAAAGTGDGSKVAYALLKTLNEKLNALDEADRPDNLVVYESSFSHDTTNQILRRTYTATLQFPEPTELA
jgi:hypothetical protein